MIKNSKLLELLETYKLEELKKALIENVREENEKASGRTSTDTAIIKRALKLNEKTYSKDRAASFNKITKSEKGYNCIICGGVYILGDSTTDFSLPAAEEHEAFKVDPILCANYPVQLDNDIFSSKEAKLFVNEHKKDNSHIYTLNTSGGIVGINAAYLADILDFVGSGFTVCTQGAKDNCIKNPLLFKSENGSRVALLLPVNVVDVVGALEYMEKWRAGEV